MCAIKVSQVLNINAPLPKRPQQTTWSYQNQFRTKFWKNTNKGFLIELSSRLPVVCPRPGLPKVYSRPSLKRERG